MADGARKTAQKPRRSPVQARSQATVAAILEASARILRREGAKGLTTAAIASKAGVSVGSIYDYFPTKDAILIALARALMDADVRAIEKALAQGPNDPIRTVIGTLITRHRTDRSYRRKVMAAHIGAGHAAEHAQSVHAAMEFILRHVPEGAGLDPLAIFVSSRAVLGVCRALVDEPSGREQDPIALEIALVALVRSVIEQELKP